MSLTAGLSRYRGKKQNSTTDQSSQTIYTKYYEIAPGKDLGDILGLERGDVMPEETGKNVLSVRIFSEKIQESMCKVVEITGYQNKEWS